MTTMMAVVRAINYISQREEKTVKEVVLILLVEALTARGMMTPMNKETK